MKTIEPTPLRELDPQEIADAKELFLKYGWKRTHQIVRGMHERGWMQFRRSELCGRPHIGRHAPVVGLIDALGWNELYQESLPPASPNQGAELNKPPTFKEWLIKTKPEWHWNWKYQNYIYKALDRMTRGRTKRMMVFMPPRHGKSELVTVRYAAWVLLNRPQTRIIIGSYNQKLANRFSRQIRRIFENSTMNVGAGLVPARSSDNHDNGQVQDLPLRLLNMADEWETAAGGGVKAVGVGAGVTGFGADLIIIDDPIKGRADAESKNNRERVWEWYCDDLHTRLEPGGQIILIQTRWHQDDLAGRLLNEQESEGEKWEVVKLPALAEGSEPGAVATGLLAPPSDVPIDSDFALGKVGVQTHLREADGKAKPFRSSSGKAAKKNAASSWKPAKKNPADPLNRRPGEPLCPARFDKEALEAKRKKLGSYSFSALYQQSPVPADGNVFKRSWFSNIIERAPDGLRWYRTYDLAISTKTSADYTASVRLAQDKDGTIYIADIFRKRIEYPEQLRYITGRIEAERDTEHGIESALHGLAFIQELRRNARLSSAAFRGIRVNKDKLTRALAWANRAEEGKLVLVRGAWNADFIDEACAFPNGRHDDQIDAVSLAVEMVSVRKRIGMGF